MHVAGVALGFLIGIALGLLGGGGSILTVPVFVYILGFGAKEAIAMSLVVVGITSLVGAAEHGREGHVNVRVALVFGAVAMLATYMGARLATWFSGGAQLAALATIMLIAATFMFRGHGSDLQGPVVETTGLDATRTPVGLTVVHAGGVGLLTGLVGVGGGFLIVPALVWGGLPMRDAVGTSLLVIAMNCAVGFYGYLGEVSIAWRSIALVTAGTLPGIAAGTYLIRFVTQQALRRGFAVFLGVVAVYMLYRSLVA